MCILVSLLGLFAQHLIWHQSDRRLVLMNSLLRRVRVGLMHKSILLVAFLEFTHFLACGVGVKHVDDDATVQLRAMLLVRRCLGSLRLACFRPPHMRGHTAIAGTFAVLADKYALRMVMES